MDPVACLKRLDDAMRAGDRAEVADAATDLREWIRGGGFLPSGPNGTDWRGHLTAGEWCSHLYALAAVARMA